MNDSIEIKRSDLPHAAPSLEFPECIAVEGVSHSVWPITRGAANQARLDAYEYLAAAEAIDSALLSDRREAVCVELGCPGLYPTLIESAPMKRAIDRIIELESAA